MASSLPLFDCARTSGQHASGVNVLASICHAPHQAYECGTRTFVGESGRHASGSPKNASGHSAFPQREVPQATGNKPNSSEKR